MATRLRAALRRPLKYADLGCVQHAFAATQESLPLNLALALVPGLSFWVQCLPATCVQHEAWLWSLLLSLALALGAGLHTSFPRVGVGCNSLSPGPHPQMQKPLHAPSSGRALNMLPKSGACGLLCLPQCIRPLQASRLIGLALRISFARESATISKLVATSA